MNGEKFWHDLEAKVTAQTCTQLSLNLEAQQSPVGLDLSQGPRLNRLSYNL